MLFFSLTTLSIAVAQIATSDGHLLSRANSEPPGPLADGKSVRVAGKTYINKGLVAFGAIPSNATDSTGDTIGGIGSAIAFQGGSFTQHSDGTFSGTIIAQPDRGFNIDGTIDWQARQHHIDFVLTPYYDTEILDFDVALNTLKLTYRDTLLYKDHNGQKTTGLDANGLRHVDDAFEIPLPVAKANGHLSIDAEGLVLNSDGSFWMSDEYGPYIYLVGPEGRVIRSIQPPKAILPLVEDAFNFTSVQNPHTGRVANKGFEGLTIDSKGHTLYALLELATVQDGGNEPTAARFTRLLAFDVSDPAHTSPLVGEWIVPLPQDSKGNTVSANEVHFVSEGVFLVLSRDTNGHGGEDVTSTFKQADLLDLSDATDIHGTEFDSPRHPIAKMGELDKRITPGTLVSFVDFIDETQLARFGVHNGEPADRTLIDAKWESLALVSCMDPAFPDDFFLFTAADNDFISTQGVALGKPFNAGLDNDNQFMVFRVTLPGAARGRHWGS